MHDPRVAMGNPSFASLSQPGLMMSYHPGGHTGSMMDFGAHPLFLPGMGGLVGENKGSQGRASSMKSGDSLERAHRSLSVEDDLDLVDPVEDEDQPKVGVVRCM